jgi:hypothetical protein
MVREFLRPSFASGFGGCAGALLIALLAGLWCAPVRAEFLYVCTDKAGKRWTGSVPPAECKDSDIRELNPDGTLHSLIPAPLTREQQKRRQEEREAQLRKEEEERAQSRRDRALLETYGSIGEIDEARKRALAGRQVLVDRADSRIEQYQRERKHLDDEAEFYKNREMPQALKDAFDANQVLVAQQQRTRADAIAEMKNINERFDAEKKRYGELEEMAAQAAAAREREAAQSVQ